MNLTKKTNFKSGHLSGVSIHGVIFKRGKQNSFTLLYSMTLVITSIQSIRVTLKVLVRLILESCQL
jgi:hypothetical protein